MPSDDGGVVVRVDGAGSSLDAPSGWTAVDTDADNLSAVLATLGTRRTVVIVPETAAAAALPVGAPTSTPEGRVSVVQTSTTESLSVAAADTRAPTGWQAGLSALQAALDTDAWPALPEGLARLAPVRNVLESAGQIGRVTADDGTTWVACGFPDLRRPSSKVLLVRDDLPRPEIIALHRFPRRVGVVTTGSDRWLPGDQRVDSMSTERTGRPAPEGGDLFAVEPARVFLVEAGRVRSWDGRRMTDEGTSSQALASLVLRWSQR